MMYCEYCGATIRDDSAFCEVCGKPCRGNGNTQAKNYSAAGPGNPQSPQHANAKASSSSKAPVAIIIAVIVAVIACIAIAIFALGGGNEGSSSAKTASVSHTVRFETFGGTEYETITADNGQVINAPVDPRRSGSTFICWCTDPSLENSVTFPYTISADDPENIIFYAKWLGGNAPANASDSSPDSIKYANCVFPLSSSTYLTEADLYPLSSQQLQRAINELYARNGYIFQQSMSEKAFFESQPWYRGYETNQDIVKSRFNQYEQANIQLMQSYRATHS